MDTNTDPKPISAATPCGCGRPVEPDRPRLAGVFSNLPSETPPETGEERAEEGQAVCYYLGCIGSEG